MPQVLTTNAIIMCPHGGKGTTIPSAPKWSVNGGFVCLEGDTGTLACPFALYPCLGYTLKSMGLNATTVDGRKVVLATDFQQTFTGLPLTITETHQALDDTSPAPIPAGQSAQPLPPDMQDTGKPVVVAAPPALVFNSMTMLPPTAAITFTLTSSFPSQWILTLINGAIMQNLDITNGLPPGIVVAPVGGQWASPSLVVAVTLTAVGMAGLGPGAHYFCMTGVNKRGLSGFAQAVLTVS